MFTESFRAQPRNLLIWLSLLLQSAVPINAAIESVWMSGIREELSEPESIDDMVQLAQQQDRFALLIGRFGLILFLQQVFLARVRTHPRWIFWSGMIVGLLWLLLDNNFLGLVTIVLIMLMRKQFVNVTSQSVVDCGGPAKEID
ncbi:MAG: hypothetical protein KDB01_01405 [Planctomycetaceae bacterium]|nr:hypothetical protein [Planctomycetaceae bacterium]